MRDAFVVGVTGSGGATPKPDEPHFPIRGFVFYDGPVHLTNVRFVNFCANSRRAAGALSYLRFSPFFMDPGNNATALTFKNAQPVYLERRRFSPDPKFGADVYRSAVLIDRDGSVTRRPGHAVAIDNPFLLHNSCVAPSQGVSRRRQPRRLCPLRTTQPGSQTQRR